MSTKMVSHDRVDQYGTQSQISSLVSEKTARARAYDVEQGEAHESAIADMYSGKLGAIARRLELYGVEARGYQRVLDEERSPQSIWGLCLIWASAGMTISSFTVRLCPLFIDMANEFLKTGFYGPQYYNLSMGQSTAIIWTAGAAGSACSAYLAIFGKRHGLRALVNSRYAFGYYGAMIMSALNIFTELVYGILACIQGGQTLNTMTSQKLPVWVGVLLIGISSWILGTAGFKYIHYYERVAWILPLIIYICLYSKGGSQFSLPLPTTDVDSLTSAGLALSYVAIIFGSSAGWVAVSADYYIYFPLSTPDYQIFSMFFLGVWIIPSFATTCGAEFGAAMYNNTAYQHAYSTGGETSAALIEYVLRPLGNVRLFFLFILAFSMMSNNVFNLYSIGISMQLFGKGTAMIPRFCWTFLATIVMIIVACIGYESLYTILSNLIAIIGYWTIIYFVILVEEHLLFRRSPASSQSSTSAHGYDLSAWDTPHLLPKGYAGMVAFLIGAAGAIVGMCETWYTGPVGRLIGSEGGDLGIEVAFVFAGVSYPALRWWERRVWGGR